MNDHRSYQTGKKSEISLFLVGQDFKLRKQIEADEETKKLLKILKGRLERVQDIADGNIALKSGAWNENKK